MRHPPCHSLTRLCIWNVILTICFQKGQGFRRFRALEVLNGPAYRKRTDSPKTFGGAASGESVGTTKHSFDPSLGHHEQRIQSYDEEYEEEDDDDDDDVVILHIEQPLTHFADTNQTFQQRFFYSARYTKPDPASSSYSSSYYYSSNSSRSGPVLAFLCVGGEGPYLTKGVLTGASPHCSGDMLELAKLLFENDGVAVHLFALEHRYYGTSYPTFTDADGNPESPVTNENLRYLSSRQGLRDLSRFVERTTDDPKFAPRIDKWVTFGGSYPGFMAAMARKFFPEIIHAAVSSSAPIEMVLDFGGYNDRVAWDLQYDVIGGSQRCLDIVRRGHEELRRLLVDEGSDPDSRSRVADLFDVCNGTASLAVAKNVDFFLGDGVIYVPAQANDPTDPHSNIATVCSFLIDQVSNQSSSAMEALAAFSKWQGQRTPSSSQSGPFPAQSADVTATARSLRKRHHQSSSSLQPTNLEGGEASRRSMNPHEKSRAHWRQQMRGHVGIYDADAEDDYDDDDDDDDTCLDVDWQASLDFIASPELGQDEGLRSWLWQTCTEFGYYQTCEENSQCPFGRGHHLLTQDLEICEYAFGVNASSVMANVNDTLHFYGGPSGDGWSSLNTSSRILSVNGDVDPWSVLALVRENGGGGDRFRDDDRDRSDPRRTKGRRSRRDPLPTLWVEGASHHFWTHPVRPTDDERIKQARATIYLQVMEWLSIATSSAHAPPPMPLGTEATE